MATIDKKEYQTVIEALTTVRTVAQFHERLNKIFLSTEDVKLKQVLGPALSTLRDASGAMAARKMSGAKVPLNLEAAEYGNLIAYCSALLKSEKPQWQILAERHGWKPPAG